MIHEIYHPHFSDDLIFLLHELGKKKGHECLLQIDRTIEHIIRFPHKAAKLIYPPLTDYRKKKFFPIARPGKRQRPNMRLIYKYNPDNQTIYFLAVGIRLTEKPRNTKDIYQRIRNRNDQLYKKE
ncbi:hypothetical protein IC620_00540 [Hazenella sp. IB182357]|uniref:Uncharacterized protein n=1 Tax=Polycladospora coralii TaxID=2771432 RepID=A0A926NCE5_9BACL|nr:hypothetical protein [Polycladospora coralii]MBD1370848.1 hypothetical protein [Polycladospora coralii]MBS7529787.1 hypothetical protein [Polycladospora coralii]